MNLKNLLAFNFATTKKLIFYLYYKTIYLSHEILTPALKLRATEMKLGALTAKSTYLSLKLDKNANTYIKYKLSFFTLLPSEVVNSRHQNL